MQSSAFVLCEMITDKNTELKHLALFIYTLLLNADDPHREKHTIPDWESLKRLPQKSDVVFLKVQLKFLHFFTNCAVQVHLAPQ